MFHRFRLSTRQTPKAIAALAVLGSLVYAMFVPHFRGPDEPQHVDLVLYSSTGASYPTPFDRYLSKEVVSMMVAAEFPRASTELDASEDPPRDERPARSDMGSSAPTQHANQITQHPPLYYYTVGFQDRVARVFFDPMTWDKELFFLRLFGVLLVGVFPLCAAEICRLLGYDDSVAVSASLLSVAAPQLLFVGATVNTDVFFNGLAAIVFMMHTALFVNMRSPAASQKRIRWLLVGSAASVGLMALTKGFALLFIPIGLVLSIMALMTKKTRFRPADAAMYWSLTFVFGGWWWLRNIIVYDAIQPSKPLVNSVEPFDGDEGLFITSYLWNMSTSFWGNLGWLEVSIGPELARALSIAVLLLVVAGLVSSGRRMTMLVLSSPFVLTFWYWGIHAWGSYLNNGVFAGMQGRYFFGSVLGCFVVAAIGMSQLSRGNLRFLNPLLFLGIALLQARMGLRGLRRWYGRPEASFADRLHSASDWAPLDIGFQIATLCALLLAGLVVFGLLVKQVFESESRLERSYLAPVTTPNEGVV